MLPPEKLPEHARNPWRTCAQAGEASWAHTKLRLGARQAALSQRRPPVPALSVPLPVPATFLQMHSQMYLQMHPQGLEVLLFQEMLKGLLVVTVARVVKGC